MRAKIFALYKGDDFVTMGTKKEIAEETGLSMNSLQFYHSPAHMKIITKNSYILIDTEEEEPMSELAIEELTRILLEEHESKDKEKYIISKEDLIRFCIKLEKTIMRCEE